ncbi:MAG: DUF4132 domain-containing protein [Isosphaeraceae bacterium]
MARTNARAGEVDGDPIHSLIDGLLAESPRGKYGGLYGVDLGDTKSGPKLIALDRDGQAEAVARLVGKVLELDRKVAEIRGRAKDHHNPQLERDWDATWTPRQLAEIAIRGLLRRKLPLSDATLRALLDWAMNPEDSASCWFPLLGICSAAENRAAEGPLGDDLNTALEGAIRRCQAGSEQPECRKAAGRLARLLSAGPLVHLEPGEAWSDAANADLDAMEPARRHAWDSLLAFCQEAGQGKPTAAWRKRIGPLLEGVGRDNFRSQLVRWFPLVDRPRTQPWPRRHAWEPDHDNLIVPQHVELLKALAWAAGLKTDRELARALSALALSAYRKVPGRGPRAPSLGHAAVNALGMMPGMDAVGQLALLKVKVKFIPAQKEVEKALHAAAQREGLPVEEIEELAVPAYGMDEVGRRREVLGDYFAELVADGIDAEIRWSKSADGKALKSAPAAAKKEHADEVKELQAAAKDVGKMLAAQRERIDGLFLLQKKWLLEAWKDRYLDHPLVGVIARRLIWTFEAEGKTANGIWLDGQLVDAQDRPIGELGSTTTVTLWHPIGRPIGEVTAWRDWFDRHQVRQPFKQAYREVYVLTDAERATNVYSNRFAAHVLRQHQYNALCAARGWRNKLRLMVDDTYPPTSKDLPLWGLRAEFWVEGIGDGYGQDTTESGSYLYLSTDQVRFYGMGSAQREAHAGGGGYSAAWNREDAEPVQLDRIPPLVLSEILRDVDLFVGVASVGNDPTWSDGGPDGRHVDYWTRYSFGDLTANGQTRKAVLERLIPRLKIAARCQFHDKFLVVRGDLRTYKIHLGSGNILMEPNDQYLCIVPKRGDSNEPGGVFLPFEGDNTLSIILSKALMLAEDAKIGDPTIVSQIKR